MVTAALILAALAVMLAIAIYIPAAAIGLILAALYAAAVDDAAPD
jgi:hypothetical protein